MTRLRGRAVRGQRVHDHAPAGHWCATTMLGSLRLDGTTSCMTIEGATDTAVFRAYVEHVLLPTLQPGMWSSSTTSRRTRTRRHWRCWRRPPSAFGFCRPTARTSTPSRRCGARSKKRSAPPRPGPNDNWVARSPALCGPSPPPMPQVGLPRAALLVVNMLYRSNDQRTTSGTSIRTKTLKTISPTF